MPATPAPVVVMANRFRFAVGERVEIRRMRSRCFAWCIAGQGGVAVDAGAVVALAPGDWLLAPWEATLHWQAAAASPLLIGCVHVVPRLPLAARYAPGVGRAGRSAPADDELRSDAPIAGRTGLVQGVCVEHPALLALADYLVTWWQDQRDDAAAARRLGSQWLLELERALGSTAVSRPQDPAVAQAVGYARAHLHLPLSVDDLAAVAGISRATLERAFRRDLGQSVMAWLRERRLWQARQLLANSRTPVADIGSQVGFPDPAAFSRAFRAAYGSSPRAWRTRHGQAV